MEMHIYLSSTTEHKQWLCIHHSMRFIFLRFQLLLLFFNDKNQRLMPDFQCLTTDLWNRILFYLFESVSAYWTPAQCVCCAINLENETHAGMNAYICRIADAKCSCVHIPVYFRSDYSLGVFLLFFVQPTLWLSFRMCVQCSYACHRHSSLPKRIFARRWSLKRLHDYVNNPSCNGWQTMRHTEGEGERKKQQQHHEITLRAKQNVFHCEMRLSAVFCVNMARAQPFTLVVSRSHFVE